MEGNELVAVAGIGASAGGLEALKNLFSHLPTDSGVAFVVIQHLDPRAKSLTAEILSRFTTMPALQATDGMTTEADHIYVIPPNAYLTLSGSTLTLSEPVLMHGLRMPIDTFLLSLAEEYEEKAIAIILSGTGSDGTLGVRAIGGHGGLVLVQTPETAEYDGMPRSAIATGVADFACPVDAMPDHLTKYLHHPFIARPGAADVDQIPEDDTGGLDSILRLLNVRGGYDFRAYKTGTLWRRIARRMVLGQVQRLSDYLTLLKTKQGEVAALIKDLLIGVTAFFRDPEAFATLDREVLAQLVDNKTDDRPLRIWVPGCASGEEAYSIAMLLIERLDNAHKHCPVQVFATDVDEAALAVGRTAIYPENALANVPAERIGRFFTRDDHRYQVIKHLRDSVTFAAQNVISDPPFSKLDLISCRNLLIYLDAATQRKILALFHFALLDDGCLFLGNSETVGQQESLFEPVDKKSRIYRRSGTARPVVTGLWPGPTQQRHIGDAFSPRPRLAEQALWSELVQQQLLQEYAPAAVLTNTRHQILHFFGPTGLYLNQPPGAPTQDLVTLARHELRGQLRAALQGATDEKQRELVRESHVVRNGEQIPVKITVKTLSVPRIPDRVLLVIFEDQPEPSPLPSTDMPATTEADATLVQQLEHELIASRDDLRSSVEELEAANEELQGSNEEVMSVNEELQSSNEELESSKEELQSMNEELTTINSELKENMAALATAKDDLENFITSTDIATLFLDRQLRIGNFTPASKRLLNLIDSDVGRPFRDIRPTFTGGNLIDEARRVLEDLVPLETEIQGEQGHSYLRRTSPYRTKDNRIGGVVVTFVDITHRILAEQDAQRLATVVRDSNDAITVQTPDGRITAWNKGAHEMYGWSEQEALAMSIQDIVPEAERQPERDFMKKVVAGERLEQFDTLRISKDGHVMNVWLTVTPLADVDGRIVAVATTERDVTQRKLAEAQLQVAMKSESAHARRAQFLATASHDLRQPLQSLNLLNSALLRTTHDPEAQKMLKMESSALVDMRWLLNSLLDTSKLDSGDVVAAIEDTPVRPILERLRAELETEAQQKGLDLRVETGDVMARTDPHLLAQLLRNLVGNAIRYTNRGSVDLACERSDGQLRFTVSDTGIGIPPDQLDRIFDEFHQVNPNTSEAEHSLGLGLAIVRRVANLLSARVDVESVLGHGSKISFSVPASDSTSVAPPTEDRSKTEVPRPQPLGHGSSILLVDDEPAVLDSTKLLLSIEGLEVTAAASPQEAYAALETLTPDLIITDLHLGQADSGAEIIRVARDRTGRRIPAIIVTGDTSASLHHLDIECTEVMSKPLKAEELLMVARQLIEASLQQED